MLEQCSRTGAALGSHRPGMWRLQLCTGCLVYHRCWFWDRFGQACGGMHSLLGLLQISAQPEAAQRSAFVKSRLLHMVQGCRADPDFIPTIEMMQQTWSLTARPSNFVSSALPHVTVASEYVRSRL